MILSGTLLTPTGQPYRNSYIRLVARTTSQQVLQGTSGSFKTDDNGAYSIDCPFGYYYVVVTRNSSIQNIGSIIVNENTTETSINELIIISQTAVVPLIPVVVAQAAVFANAANASAIVATTKADEAAASATLTASLLSTKEDVILEGTNSQYWRGDKTFQTLDKNTIGLSNVDNTSDSSKPVSTPQQTALNLKTDNSVSLMSWAYNNSFQLVSATRDSNGAIIEANIKWPDGILGVFTTDAFSTEFPGAIDAWHATYLAVVPKTITQAVVTRDSNGAVVIQPEITIT